MRAACLFLLAVAAARAATDTAKVIQDVIVLEPMGAELSVRENIIWQNSGQEAFRDASGGTLRFYAPPEAKDTLRVSAAAPGALPQELTATPAGPRNVFKVDFPIQPGETSFEVTYRVPLSSPASFSGRAVQRDTPLRLAVPAGVTLKGEGLELLGQEPQSQATVYGVKTANFKVEIEGTGSMAAAAAEGTEDTGSGLDQILPRVYGSIYAILGLAFAVLALGFILLYRKRAPASPGSAGRR